MHRVRRSMPPPASPSRQARSAVGQQARGGWRRPADAQAPKLLPWDGYGTHRGRVHECLRLQGTLRLLPQAPVVSRRCFRVCRIARERQVTRLTERRGDLLSILPPFTCFQPASSSRLPSAPAITRKRNPCGSRGRAAATAALRRRSHVTEAKRGIGTTDTGRIVPTAAVWQGLSDQDGTGGARPATRIGRGSRGVRHG